MALGNMFKKNRVFALNPANIHNIDDTNKVFILMKKIFTITSNKCYPMANEKSCNYVNLECVSKAVYDKNNAICASII